MTTIAPFPAQTDGGIVTHEELRDALNAGTVAVVDVREPNEFEAGRIPGAINLPLSRFDYADLPKGKPIVLVETAYAWTFEDQDGYPNIIGPWYSPPPEYPVTPVGQALFIGPNVFYRVSESLRVTAAWNVQVAGKAVDDPGALDLTNFSRHQIRIRIGYQF